jgi:hypothetical protein
MTSLVYISGASAQPVDEGIAIHCSLGDSTVPPGTIINLPPAGDLPAVVVVCGNDGKWHVPANIVKRTSPRLLSPPVVAKVMQLQRKVQISADDRMGVPDRGPHSSLTASRCAG